MGGVVDLLQLPDRDLGVDLSGVEPGMAKLLLDEADVRSVFMHQRGASVAQQVTAPSLCEVGGFDVVACHLGEPVRRERLVEVRQKERAGVGFSNEVRADFFAVATHPLDRSISDGDHAVFRSLPLPDHDGAALFVDVVQAEVHQLHSSHSGRVKHFEHRSISDAKRVF